MTPVRPGHGTGAGTPHIEIPFDEQAPANPDQTAINLAERRKRGKPFEKNNGAGRGRRPVLALLGVDPASVPELARKDVRRADRYRRRRVAETTAVTGYTSAGAAAIFSSAALVLASARQVAAIAFQTGDPAMHKLAADLSEKHSQLEIKARWLAKDEAAARPASDPLAAARARISATAAALRKDAAK